MLGESFISAAGLFLVLHVFEKENNILVFLDTEVRLSSL